MFKNKKSSLSLSINAIVILILAITMLGLGLGFIRTMFGKVTMSVEEQLANEPEPAIASATDLITVSRETIVTTRSATEPLKFSTYNHKVASGVSGIAVSGCTGFTLAKSTPTVAQYQSGKVTGVLTVPAAANTYICTFKDTTLNDGQVDVTVIVK